jgi:thioredoxin 1
MLPLILSVMIGGGLGAGLGYVGQCSTGACPLTANWKRGAPFGAGLGLLFHLSSGGFSTYQPPKNLKPVTEAAFETEVLQATQPVLVDFYAPWCGPCKAMSPALDRVAGELSAQMKFVQVNIDEAQGLARRFEVSAVPTLLVFKRGKIVETLAGAKSAQELRARLGAFAAANPLPMAGL